LKGEEQHVAKNEVSAQQFIFFLLTWVPIRMGLGMLFLKNNLLQQCFEKCSGRANKASPESKEMDRFDERDSSCSLATSEMQHFQVPVESVKTAVKRMRTVAKLKHMTLSTWSLAS
jgi:hypothetical protein